MTPTRPQAFIASTPILPFNILPFNFAATVSNRTTSTFIPTSLLPRRKRLRTIHGNNNATTTPKMIVDPVTVGTGYAFLNSLKGVVIGPTVNEIMAAVCGGTVGVMSTIIILEVRRQQVKERKQCPYCHGAGKLPCASCYSIGTIPSASVATAQESCSACSESGYLRCNHCEGDGRLIPWVYERAMRSQFEDYIYTAVDDYYQDQPPYV